MAAFARAIREARENRYNPRLAECETFVAVGPNLVTERVVRLD
jgi:hypothetical protein